MGAWGANDSKVEEIQSADLSINHDEDKKDWHKIDFFNDLIVTYAATHDNSSFPKRLKFT